MKFLFLVLFTVLFTFSLSTSFAQIKSLAQLNEVKAQADSLVKIKEYDKAVDLYESLLPNLSVIDAILYYEIAMVYYTDNNFKKALDNFDKSLTLSEKNKSDKMLSAIHLMYARIYSKQGNSKEVISELKKSLKYNDQSTESHITLSYEYLQIGKNKKALIEAKKAIEIDPKLAYSYNNAGLALIRLKKYEEGKKMIMASLDRDAKNPYAYKHLAYYYLGINDTEKACEALKKAEELGYKEFGNEYDQNEVEELMKKYCN